MYGGFCFADSYIKEEHAYKTLIFLLILAIGFGTVVISQNTHTETAEVKLYYVDAQMLRLIPVKTQIPQMSTQKMAQRVADELVEGYDDNPKIRQNYSERQTWYKGESA